MKRVSFHHTIEILPFFNSEPVLETVYHRNWVPLTDGSGKRLRRQFFSSNLKYIIGVVLLFILILGFLSI